MKYERLIREPKFGEFQVVIFRIHEDSFKEVIEVLESKDIARLVKMTDHYFKS